MKSWRFADQNGVRLLPNENGCQDARAEAVHCSLPIQTFIAPRPSLRPGRQLS
jgi:hypothetical protein